MPVASGAGEDPSAVGAAGQAVAARPVVQASANGEILQPTAGQAFVMAPPPLPVDVAPGNGSEVNFRPAVGPAGQAMAARPAVQEAEQPPAPAPPAPPVPPTAASAADGQQRASAGPESADVSASKGGAERKGQQPNALRQAVWKEGLRTSADIFEAIDTNGDNGVSEKEWENFNAKMGVPMEANVKDQGDLGNLWVPRDLFVQQVVEPLLVSLEVPEGSVAAQHAKSPGELAEHAKAKVNYYYLPMTIDGQQVLFHEEGNKYSVDTMALGSADGIAWRNSKSMKDKAARDPVVQGAIVQGQHAGDGWLKVKATKEATPREGPDEWSVLRFSLKAAGYVVPGQILKLVDANGDSWIDHEEFERFARHMGLTEEEAEAISVSLPASAFFGLLQAQVFSNHPSMRPRQAAGLPSKPRPSGQQPVAGEVLSVRNIPPEHLQGRKVGLISTKASIDEGPPLQQEMASALKGLIPKMEKARQAWTALKTSMAEARLSTPVAVLKEVDSNADSAVSEEEFGAFCTRHGLADDQVESIKLALPKDLFIRYMDEKLFDASSRAM